MNIIPASIHRRIAHRPNLVKIVDNIGWLFFDKILRMSVGLFVMVWVARYLGPEQFGLLNFATAFTGLFGAVAALGLQGIVVRDIVRDPESAKVTLGTAALLQLIGGLISFLLILGAIAYLRPDDALARSIVAILGSMMLLKASEVAVYWFESQVQSKYTVWVRNGVFLMFAGIKVLLILQQAQLIAFAWAILAEAAVVAMILLIVMDQCGPALTSLHVSADRAKTLLRDSWPLIFMGLMLSVYTKIDIVMVEYFLGSKATGIYSAAVTIAECWFFIPVVVVNTIYPALINAHEKINADFEEKIIYLYSVMFWFPFVVSFVLMLSSKFIFTNLYGSEYVDAVSVFQLYVWSGIFVFVITASSRWYLVKNNQIGLLYRAVLGAFLNVGLNYGLLPVYGLHGAATATLVTYFIVAYAYDWFDKHAREQAKYKIIAIISPQRIVQGLRGEPG